METQRIDQYIAESRIFEIRTNEMKNFVLERAAMVHTIAKQIQHSLSLENYKLPPSLKWTEISPHWKVRAWMGSGDGYIGITVQNGETTYVAHKRWFTDTLAHDEAERMVKEEFRQASIWWLKAQKIDLTQRGIDQIRHVLSRIENGESVSRFEVPMLNEKEFNELINEPNELFAVLEEKRGEDYHDIRRMRDYLKKAETSTLDEWYEDITSSSVTPNDRRLFLGVEIEEWTPARQPNNPPSAQLEKMGSPWSGSDN